MLRLTNRALFLVLLIALVGVPFSFCQSSADIVIDQVFLSKSRASVGEEVTVGLRFEWADTGQPVQGPQVSIDGQYYFIWQDGWVLIKDIENEVMKKTYIVNDIRFGGSHYTWEMLVDPPEVIWDKVKIELYPEYERVNVGSPPQLTNYSYYMYDYEFFEGDIGLNVTGPVKKVGSHGITVDWIKDHKYGVHTFEATVATQIWDTVKVILYKDKSRYNLGREADIGYLANFDSDLNTFYGTVTLNDTTKKDQAGLYHFTAEEIFDHNRINNVTIFESNVIDVIYDKVELELTVEDSRINVGEEVKINYTGQYIYDGGSFLGDLRLNYPLVCEFVDKRTIEVRRIQDNRFFLDYFEANSLDVIWDRIKVDITTEDTRVDVGEKVEVQVDAYYEYDNTPIPEGDYSVNALSLTLNEVGNFTFKAENAYGAEYDITAVDFEEVNVVWDMVVFDFEPTTDRLILGTGDRPRIKAKYSYDGEEFKGSYKLNNFIPTTPGRYTFRVVSMNDPNYELTSFTSGEQEYYFDNVMFEEYIESAIPGRIKYVYKVTWQSDYAPIDNAVVLIGGQPCVYNGNGFYVLQAGTLSPSMEKDVQIWVHGHLIEEKTVNTILVGNIGSMGVLGAAIILGAFKLVKYRQAKKKKEELKYEYLEYDEPEAFAEQTLS
jgi:hypothetical protein